MYTGTVSCDYVRVSYKFKQYKRAMFYDNLNTVLHNLLLLSLCRFGCRFSKGMLTMSF